MKANRLNRLKKKSLRTEKKPDDKRGTNPNSLANLHPFVPGVSGNPGGRPKLLSEAYREWLAAIDPKTGRTNAQLVAQSQGLQSILGETTAAKELRQATEGDLIRDLSKMTDAELDDFIAQRERGALPGVSNPRTTPEQKPAESDLDT